MTYSYHPGSRRVVGWLRVLSPSWPMAVAAAIYALLLGLGGRLLNDPDTYWQITLGRWIVAQGQVPRVDEFSYTMAGEPWISSQWLAQVLFAGAMDWLGWSGVVILAAVAIAAAFGLLAKFLLERLSLLPALVLVSTAFMLTAPHLVSRPHTLALPIMVAWVAGLLRALEDGKGPSYLLLPLMTIWANLHGGFTFGLALLAPIVLEALLQTSPSQRLIVFLRWSLFGVLAVVAACVTPYGPESILVTGRILGLGPALALIGEWRPQDFATLTGFGLCLLGGIGFSLYRGLTLPPVRLLVLLGLLYMALSHARNAELLGLLAPLFLARPLAAQLDAPRDGQTAPDHGNLYGGTILALLLAGLSIAVASARDYGPPPSITPVQAVDAVRSSGKERIFNSYEFGGYLIYEGIRPFIDGRTELYGREFVLRHDRAETLKDVGEFFDLLDEYDVDVVLLAPHTPAVGLLDRLKGWQRVYGDNVAVVFIKTSGTGSADEIGALRDVESRS